MFKEQVEAAQEFQPTLINSHRFIIPAICILRMRMRRHMSIAIDMMRLVMQLILMIRSLSSIC